jgi:hypothetical protein
MIIADDVRINYEIAYDIYSKAYDLWGQISNQAMTRLRRQIEGAVTEAGFRGVRTGLISEKAWETVIYEKKGMVVGRKDRIAQEHPVTHKNVALYCLTQPRKLSFDEFYDVWFNNLVTTWTTNDENQRLRKFQSTFKFGVDCWKQMYENAGIVLMERPKLNTKAAKQKYGII